MQTGKQKVHWEGGLSLDTLLTTAFLTTFFFFNAPESFALPPPVFLGADFGPRSTMLASACRITLKDCIAKEKSGADEGEGRKTAVQRTRLRGGKCGRVHRIAVPCKIFFQTKPGSFPSNACRLHRPPSSALFAAAADAATSSSHMRVMQNLLGIVQNCQPAYFL